MWTALVAIAIATLPRAPDFVPREVDYDRPVAELCFPSGLRVAIVQDVRQPVVSITTIIDRGANADPPGREGAAHLLEHLWFRAEANGRPVALTLDDVGARHNALTLGDATVYLTVADVAALPTLLDLEALRLSDPLAGVTDEAVEEERAIVASELDLRGVVLDDLPRLMPPDLHGGDQRLRPRNHASIAAIRRDDLAEVASAYVPYTTTLHVVGDVHPRDVLAAVEHAFPEDLLYRDASGATPREGACGPRRPATAATPPAPPAADAPFVFRNGAEDPILLLGWSLPAAWTDQEPAMRIAARWMEASLTDALSRRKFAGADPRCELVPGAVHSALLCMARVPERVGAQELRDRMLRGVAQAQDVRDARLDLELAAYRQRTDVALGLDALSGLTSRDALADALSNHFTGRPDWYVAALTAYDALDADAVGRFTGEWLSPARARTSLGVPDPDRWEAVWTRTGDDDEGDEELDAQPISTGDSEAEAVAAHHTWVRRTGGAAPLQPSAPRVAEPTVHRMPSGLQVLVVPHGTAPLSQVALVVHGGPLGEQRLGMDAWAWQLTGFQPAGLPQGSLANAVSLSQGRYWFETLPDARVFGITGIIANLDSQLYVLRHFAETATRIRSDPYTEARRRALTRHAREITTRPSAVGIGRWTHALGPNHPLAVDETTRAYLGASHPIGKVDKHIRDTWRPGNATVVIVGNIDPADGIAAAERWFGSWSGGGTIPRIPDRSAPPIPTSRAAFVGTIDGAEQARVVLTCRVAPDDAAGEVGTAWAEELVWSALRESELAAYDPGVSIERIGEARLLHMSATVAPQGAGATAERMAAIVDAMASSGPSDDDVARVSTRLQARLPQRYVDTRDILWATIAHGRRLRSEISGMQRALARVTPADVRAWAAPCAPGAAVSVVGPDATPLAGTSWAPHVTAPTWPDGMP